MSLAYGGHNLMHEIPMINISSSVLHSLLFYGLN